MKRIAVAAALAGAALAAREAGAFERQQHIGLGGGLSLLKVEDASLAVGGGGGIHYAYGLTDSLNFVAEGGTSLVSVSRTVPALVTTGSESRTMFASYAGAGVCTMSATSVSLYFFSSLTGR